MSASVPEQALVNQAPTGLVPSREFVELSITSFRGSIGGEHYYGRFSVHTKDEKRINQDGSVSWISRGGFGAEYHKHDGKDVERIIGAKEAAYLNKKDNEGFVTPSFRLKRGDSVTRFNDIASIIEAAKEAFPALFDPTDILVREVKAHHGVYEVLAGPTEFVDFFAKNQDYRAQRQFLIEKGYLRKPAGAEGMRQGEGS